MFWQGDLLMGGDLLRNHAGFSSNRLNVIRENEQVVRLAACKQFATFSGIHRFGQKTHTYENNQTVSSSSVKRDDGVRCRCSGRRTYGRSGRYEGSPSVRAKDDHGKGGRGRDRAGGKGRR